MASVIEDAETYQQSGLIVPSFNLENSNDLVPLTNPASDVTTLRRTSALGSASRGEFIFCKFGCQTLVNDEFLKYSRYQQSWDCLPDCECCTRSRVIEFS